MEIMFEVVLGTHLSINNAYLNMQDNISVSLKFVDNQLNNIAPEITTALIQHCVQELLPVPMEFLKNKSKLFIVWLFSTHY
jgi:hypothetical protein